MRWEGYTPTESGATVNICQSASNGKFLKPKTKASVDTVKLDVVFCEYIETYREFCVKPTAGLMFSGDSTVDTNERSSSGELMIWILCISVHFFDMAWHLQESGDA